MAADPSQSQDAGRPEPPSRGKPEAKKILCLVPMINDPRVALRIRMLQRAGFQVEALAFRTDHFPDRLPDCPQQPLGPLRFKVWYIRILEMLTHAPRIRAALRRHDLVYAFHFDMGLLALAAGAGLAKPLVLEIHDIRPFLLTPGLQGRLVRLVDRFITRAARLLLLTSDNYRTYYRDYLNIDVPLLVIENKVEASMVAAVREQPPPALTGVPLEERPLRIGYFGMLKDEWSFRLLEQLTAPAPAMVEVLLVGSSVYIRDFLRRVAQCPNMTYRGPYRHDEELAELYAAVDVVMACYPPAIPKCWARSNRYYAACLFQKPLLVRAGTGDAGEVARHRTGLVITADDVADAAAAVRRVPASQWNRWRRNMAQLAPEVYAHNSDEERALGRLIRETTGG